MSESRLDAAKKFGKDNEMPVALCVTVRVMDKLDQGYAVPLETFNKFKHGKSNGFSLSNEARTAYAEQGWVGCKFVEVKAEQKAA